MAKYLPDYQGPSNSRPTASEINKYGATGQDVVYSGYNEVVPFVYGRQTVAGPILALATKNFAGAHITYAQALTRVPVGQPIGAIEAIIINGVEKTPTIALGQNPTIITDGYFEFRFYDGTQTEPDAMMQGHIDGYTDYFPDTAYVVVHVQHNQIDSGNFDFGTSVQFRIRGRKCFDPRTSQWVWTENPSLHMRDFVTCSKDGLGRDVTGATECANYNDSLYGGLPMARTGLVINEAQDEVDILNLMSVYAECFWSYEGNSIRMVPDQMIESPDATIYKSQIRADSVIISGAPQNDIPTALSVIYSDSLIPATVFSDEHETIGTIGSQSDVNLPGVYRTIEAERRAWSRFMRLQIPGKVSFQMFDDGVMYQMGDVIELPDYFGMESVLIRISTQVEPVSIGVYQIHGEIYSPDFYPIVSGLTTVPEGGVLFGPNRQGFDALSAGLVRGVATKSQEGVKSSTGASSTITIPLAPSGAHGSNAADAQTLKIEYVDIEAPMIPNPNYVFHLPISPWNQPFIKQSPWPPVAVPYDTRAGASEAPNHAHSIVINSGIVSQSLAIRGLGAQVRNSDVDYNATGLSFISVSEIPTANVTTRFGSGQIISSSTQNQTGRAAVTVTSTQAGAHTHEPDAIPSDKLMSGFPASASRTYYDPPLSAAANHTHQTTVAISTNLRRVNVATHTFTSLSDGLIPVGGIIGFVGGAIPDNWALCNGSNGTPNLVDRFLVHGRQQDLGKSEGNGTAKISTSGTVTDSGHSHTSPSSKAARLQTEITAAHTKAVSHTHSITAEDIEFNYVPEHYGMRFIQYLGE